MTLKHEEARRRLVAADHGILCTANASGRIDAVPVCFAIHGDWLVVPVDLVKPKASVRLQRVENLAHDPRATLLCEQWDPNDWSRLWWVRASLVAAPADPDRRAELERRLRAKHGQYRTADFADLITFRLEGVSGWAASNED